MSSDLTSGEQDSYNLRNCLHKCPLQQGEPVKKLPMEYGAELHGLSKTTYFSLLNPSAELPRSNIKLPATTHGLLLPPDMAAEMYRGRTRVWTLLTSK